MTQERIQFAAGESLAACLQREGTFPPGEALEVVRQAVREVSDLHASGRLHLSISPESVFVEEGNAVRLAEPAVERLFGGAAGVDDTTPPALRCETQLRVPSQIDEARRVLEGSGIPLRPVQIDIYQLGALLCRLAGGESVDAYLRSPRAKARVPSTIQSVIDNALGHNPTTAFTDVAEFLRALSSALGTNERTLLHPIPEEQQPSQTGDTTPSMAPQGTDQDTAVEPVKNDKPSPHDELPFQTLGHYRIEARIGHGGMGDVYKAYEPALSRTVAIKVLPADFSRHDDFVRRFYAEATAAARLLHPNIVQVHYIGEDRGHHFFAMQFVQGESLGDLLKRRGKLSASDTLAIIEQTLSGLAAAHREGLIHRDIKPGNILLDASTRRALLADFGLVKSVENGAGLTATGMVMGTVDYISPEQGRGQTVDARSDLYSIGVLLYQMLSGRLPFSANTPTAMIFQHVYETARPLQEVTPEVPAPLSQIVSKLMSKSVEDRYQTAEELVADLRAFKAGKPLPSGVDLVSPEDEEDDGGIDLTSPARAGSTPGQTQIIAAPKFAREPQVPDEVDELAPTGWWQRVRHGLFEAVDRQAPGLVQQLQNTQQQIDGAVSEYARRQRHLKRLMAEAQGVRQELASQKEDWERVAQQERDHEKSVRARHEADELQQQIAAQDEELDSMRLRLAQVSAALEKLRSQRDLLAARLKVAHARLHVAGARRPASRWRRLLPSTWPKTAQAVLVLGLFIIAAYIIYTKRVDHSRSGSKSNEPGPIVETPDLPPTLPIRQFVGHTQVIHTIQFAPDEKTVATASEDGTVRIRNFTGAELHNLNTGMPVAAAIYSSSGRLIATGSTAASFNNNPSVKIWDVQTGQQTQAIIDEKGIVFDLAFSSDESSLVGVPTMSKTGRIVRWDVATGKELSSFEIPPNYFSTSGPNNAIALSPGGELIALTQNSGEIDIRNVNSPDKPMILAGSAETTLLKKRKVGNGVSSMKFSGDGNVLASGHDDGRIVFWNAHTGEKLNVIGNLQQKLSFRGINYEATRVAVAPWPSSSANPSSLQIWVPQQPKILQTVDAAAAYVTFNRDSSKFLVAELNGTATLWDLRPAASLAKRPMHYRGGGGPLSISADGNRVLAATTNSRIGVWQYPDGENFRELDTLNGNPQYVALSPDGRLAVAGGRNGYVSLWDAENGRLLRQVNLTIKDDSAEVLDPQAVQAIKDRQKANADVRCVAILPGNDFVFVATGISLLLWEVKTGVESPHFEGVPRQISAATVSRDGRIVAVSGPAGGDQGTDIRLWETSSGKQIRRINTRGSNESLALSRDGSRLLAGQFGNVQLWNATTGEAIRSFSVPSRLAVAKHTGKRNTDAVAFSPDETRVAAVAGEFLYEWSLATGEELLLAGAMPRGSLTSKTHLDLAYTADGHYLLTSGEGETLLWNSSVIE